jgi:hypothetical protein
MKYPLCLLGVGAAITLATGAQAYAQYDYAHDAITAIARGRHASFPSANCVVWANAEELGVGPAQLDGYHGLAMNINLHPLPGDGGATTFLVGMENLKRGFPTAPQWMISALERNRAAIEAACAKDSDTPILISRLSAKDRH